MKKPLIQLVLIIIGVAACLSAGSGEAKSAQASNMHSWIVEMESRIQLAEEQLGQSSYSLNDPESYEYSLIGRRVSNFISAGLSRSDLPYASYEKVLLDIVQNEDQLDILNDYKVKMQAMDHLAIIAKRCNETLPSEYTFRPFLRNIALNHLYFSFDAIMVLATYATNEDITFIENFIINNEGIRIKDGLISPSKLGIFALHSKIKDSATINRLRTNLLRSLKSDFLKSYVEEKLVPKDDNVFVLTDDRCEQIIQ